MFRRPTRSRWLTVALMALCAVQGALLGTAHHVWCSHAEHAPVQATCGQSQAGADANSRFWTGHGSNGPISSPAHDAQTCLACRYMAERSLPSFALRLCNLAVRGESPTEVAASFCAAGAPSAYHCRAPPV